MFRSFRKLANFLFKVNIVGLPVIYGVIGGVIVPYMYPAVDVETLESMTNTYTLFAAAPLNLRAVGYFLNNYEEDDGGVDNSEFPAKIYHHVVWQKMPLMFISWHNTC